MIDKLTTNEIRELWGKTYNQGGKPDWSHIFPYYHDEVEFQDSIQKVSGKENFIAMCNRLTERSSTLTMEIFSVVMEENVVFIQWEMGITYKKFPSTPMFGTTKLTFAEDNRIIHQRDYYDLWGDIFNGIPSFNKLYRNFVQKYFG
jgi:limonene-1,2-epoxide hydrolase